MDEKELFEAFEETQDKMGLKLFEVSGQSLFPVYGESGGITTRKVFYLTKWLGDGMFLTYAVYYKEPIKKVLKEAIQKFQYNAKATNPNGGDMGLPQL